MQSIYILIDPTTNECRYVGKSITPKKRLTRHLWEARQPGRKRKLYSWIKSLLTQDVKPIMIILELTKDWEYWESFYIEYFKFIGCNLANLSDGGQGSVGYKHTQQWKDNQSDRFKDRLPWNNGLALSRSHKNNISKTITGRKLSESTKKSIKESSQKTHRKKSKFTEEDVLFIRKKVHNQAYYAKMYGVHQATISNIQNGKRWS